MEEFFKVMHDGAGRIKEVHVNGQKVDNVTSVSFEWSIEKPVMQLKFEVVDKSSGIRTDLSLNGIPARVD